MSRICAIVGAGEGLGAAIAARFSREGFDLALVSRTETGSAVARDAALVARPSAAVNFHPGDATDPVSIAQALTAQADRMGPIDALVYNVRGAFTQCDPLDMTADALETVFRQEVVGAFAAAKAVL